MKKIGKTEYFYKRRGILRFKTVFLYLCETSQSRLRIQRSEIAHGRWFTPREAIDTVEYKGAKALLRKAVRGFAAISALIILCIYTKVYADTLHLKDNSILKGIVIEEYIDRILYSTIDGEEEILKSEISKIEYDEPIDNLTHLGDSAFEKGYHRTALKYYLMAQEINPHITALNNKVYHTETIIYNTPEIQKREHLALKNEIISGRLSMQSTPTKKAAPEEALLKEFGISLSRKDKGRFQIEALTKNSPFKKAGARRGDVIIAVWSKLCGYLTFKELYDLLSNPQETMITVTIERRVILPDKVPFGGQLAVKWEGVIVETLSEGSAAKKGGLKDGDLIISIADTPIRYTPLNLVLKMLGERRPKTGINIQRRLTVFKSK